MKSKLWYLTGVSLKRKIKTKWFAIANILLLIAIIGIVNIDNIINFFGGDFDEKNKLYIVDNTSYTYDTLANLVTTTSETYNDGESNFEIKKYSKTKEELKKEIEKDDKIIGLIVDKDENNYLDVTLISKEYIDNIDYQILNTSINNTKINIALSLSNIDKEEINKIYSAIDIKREYIDENKKSEEESQSMIMTTVFPFIILPFFMLTTILIQMIGAEVNDEKTTRGMEIIISNVSAKTHFYSKVIAGNTFVIMQGLLLLIYSAIAILSRKIFGGSLNSGVVLQVTSIAKDVMGNDIINKLLYTIPIVLVLMLLTFVAYSLVAGILASVTTNTEDFQQLQTPIMIVLLIGYYFAVMASNFEGSIFIRVMSYIPFISAIVSPSLLVLGEIGLMDVGISIILMILTIYLLTKYGLKIYKVGILNYSSTGLWKKMLKALKN